MLYKITLSLVLLAFAGQVNAQDSDSLTYKREVFSTKIYNTGVEAKNWELTERYRLIDKVALKKHRVGRIMLPVGAAVAAAGLYVAIDGLIGAKATTLVDGQDYEYVVRSLPKLLMGLGMFVTGGSMVQGAGDFRISAVKKYNESLKKKGGTYKTAYQSVWGITPQGNVGFRLEF